MLLLLPIQISNKICDEDLLRKFTIHLEKIEFSDFIIYLKINSICIKGLRKFIKCEKKSEDNCITLEWGKPSQSCHQSQSRNKNWYI